MQSCGSPIFHDSRYPRVMTRGKIPALLSSSLLQAPRMFPPRSLFKTIIISGERSTRDRHPRSFFALLSSFYHFFTPISRSSRSTLDFPRWTGHAITPRYNQIQFYVKYSRTRDPRPHCSLRFPFFLVSLSSLSPILSRSNVIYDSPFRRSREAYPLSFPLARSDRPFFYLFFSYFFHSFYVFEEEERRLIPLREIYVRE